MHYDISSNEECLPFQAGIVERKILPGLRLIVSDVQHCTSNQKSKATGGQSAGDAKAYYSHAAFSEIA
ncbi:hypothetical protein NX80_008555 [Xanthomonas vasicola pv. arecae]|nr:hypothetical protein NX80_008555 [Xanthomonas vasicola pv. arecae]AZR35705.1 hypothetical protein NX08_015855 [Xanthomonas vasicola]